SRVACRRVGRVVFEGFLGAVERLIPILAWGTIRDSLELPDRRTFMKARAPKARGEGPDKERARGCCAGSLAQESCMDVAVIGLGRMGRLHLEAYLEIAREMKAL